jgi:hypothetical protein
MLRTLDTPVGQSGGAQQLAKDPKRPRSIFVTVYNLDTVNAHCAFFGRSRRELQQPGPVGQQPGFALPVSQAVVPAAGNGINFEPGAGVISEAIGSAGAAVVVAISSFVLQGWEGELWACADTTNKILVDIMDGASKEF